MAVEGLNRLGTFDPRTNSIVRVQASRLRAKLKHYYSTVGREDQIRIAIPKGSYIPIVKSVTENKKSVNYCRALSRKHQDGVAILAFSNLSVSNKYNKLAAGLTEEIVAALARFVPVIYAPPDPLAHPPIGLTHGQLKAAKLIHGSVRVEKRRLRVIVRMHDSVDQRLFLSLAYDRRLKGLLSVQRELSQSIAHSIRLALWQMRCGHVRSSGVGIDDI